MLQSERAGVNRPSLSVLIPYYGERELLWECLTSLSNQIQPVDQILIYDDASPAPPDPYVPPGLPVKILRAGANRGPAYGRNQLLAAATTSHVHFHDADDLFSPEWHARVRNALETTDADVVFTEIDVADEQGIRSRRVLALDRLAADADLVRVCIQGVMLVPSGTYRREVVEAIGGYRTTLWQSEDFDFHVRLAATQPRYTVIDDALVTIRVRAHGRSQDRVQTCCSMVEAITLLARELPSEYRADLADAAARAGSTLFKIGARDQARSAFHIAKQLGPPRFSSQRPLYRHLARLVGYEATESLALTYRSLVPAGVRAYLASQ